jgi:Xaa-Pro dipeptidase
MMVNSFLSVHEADCHLSYDIAGDKLTLWIPEQRTDREILYIGPVLTHDEALTRYDIDFAYSSTSLKTYLQAVLKNGSVIYALNKTDLDGFEVTGPIDGVRLKPAINACRVIKDAIEISYIREANRITAEAHIQALKNCKLVSNEAAIHGIFVGTCLALGAKKQAYYPIVGSGENAATLHYAENNEDLKGKQLILIDAGCEWNCYACDVTRTFPLSNDWPSIEAKEIYRLVEKMQEGCIEKMRPGVLFRDLNVLAHKIAVKGLLDLGILHNGTEEEILQAGTTLAFFPHGLGHHVGLEVHDVEDGANPMPTEIFRPFGLADAAVYPTTVEQAPFASNILVHTGKELEIFSSRYGHLIQGSHYYAPTTLENSGLRVGMVVTIEPGM